MNRRVDEIRLSAYIDGELEPQEMDEVEEALRRDGEVRARFLEAVCVNARLKASMKRLLNEEEVPEEVVDGIRSHRVESGKNGLRSGLIRIAAGIVMVILGFGAGLLLDRERVRQPALSLPFQTELDDVVNEVLEFNVSGKSMVWTPQRNGYRVVVTPVKTYRDREGRYYRQYRIEVVHGRGRQEVYGLAYRTPEGRWRTRMILFGDVDKNM